MLTRSALAGLCVTALFVGWAWAAGSIDGERVVVGVVLGAGFGIVDYVRRRRRQQRSG